RRLRTRPYPRRERPGPERRAARRERPASRAPARRFAPFARIGAYGRPPAPRFALHVPPSRSRKAKRAAVRPIVDTLRHRYHVSVAEVDHQDRWQRAAIAVAVVAESNHHLTEVLDTVERFVRSAPDVEVLDTTA